MPVLTEEASRLPLPRMLRARQVFEAPRLEDAAAAVAEQLGRSEIRALVKPGMRVAIAVGSRGIRGIDRMTRALATELKRLGASPFVVPAMGSHGGATAEGQRDLLARYGVTEETTGAPVVSSMDVARIGETPGGVPVHLSRDALGADLIVPIARVKPHTDFRGRIESGLCKMLAIGLGKHIGCSRLHQEGFERFAELIPEVARCVIEKAPVGFGIAVVENAYDDTARVEAVPASDFLGREAELLVMARRLMPRILFSAIDVLVIGRIGKDISGAGMDPNIVGRTTKGPLPGFDGPAIKRIVVLGLSEASHGNAIGIGLADFTVKDILGRIDHEATDANCIASGNPEAGRVPIAMDDEAAAIRAALACTPGVDRERPRIVKIGSTMELGELEFSEALLEETRRDKRFAPLRAC